MTLFDAKIARTELSGATSRMPAFISLWRNLLPPNSKSLWKSRIPRFSSLPFCSLLLSCSIFSRTLSAASEAENTNPLVTSRETAGVASATNTAAAALTNAPSSSVTSRLTDAMSQSELVEQRKAQLEMARHYRHIRMPREAEPILIDLLSESSPESIKQQALIELAMAARDGGELPKAQQIYAQYLSRWSNDLLIPEILLRQGQLFRDMGLYNLAFAKFYAVMTSSLVLKNDKLDYYQRLVLSAQTEIAETHFQLGKYAEAADFFSRLLKQANPALNRPAAQYRLIRSLSTLERSDETVVQGQDFLAHYPESPEQPEVRFRVALALKRLGRNGESLQQVLSLLQEQKERTKEHPELWAYWQQQAGNEIGNQLYREGDYVRALSIYQALAQLDAQPAWQLPVGYQIALTYEKLSQPEKALQSYQAILQQEPALGTNAPPGTKALFEMAKWRADFVKWQAKAELSAAIQPGASEASPATRQSETPQSSKP
jgi:tetratricopeptide (TPR) repeat protein